MAVQQHLPGIFKTIRTAQELDTTGNEADAYRHYLTAVHQLTSLLQYASPKGQGALPCDKSSKLFKTAVQCLEQAQNIFNTAAAEDRDFNTTGAMCSSTAPPTLSTAMSLPNDSTHQSANSPLVNHHGFSHSPKVDRTGHPLCATYNSGYSTVGASDTRPSITGSYSGAPSSTRPHLSSSTSIGSSARPCTAPSQQNNVQTLHRISPMDDAKKKNVHLMAQYQAHLRKNSQKIFSDPRQNISLNYLRRLEENLSVAKITEQNMARKLREREARIKEASKKKQMSVDSLSVEQLIEEVALYEKGKKKSTCKEKLCEGFVTRQNIIAFITEVLNLSNHPLCRLFGECQYSVVQLLQPLIKAIEKAGDLPRLNISCDNTTHQDVYLKSKDSGSTCTVQTSPSPSRASTGQSSSSLDSIDLKLAHLRSELLGDSTGADLASNSNHTHVDHTSDSPEYNQYFEDDSTLSNNHELNKFLRRQNYNISDDAVETNLDKTHIQRTDNDDVFDGGVVSRSLTFFTVKCSEPSEMGVVDEGIELVEVDDAVFKGIVPLKCTLSLGKTDVLEKLARISEPYIDAVVKLISSALDKLIDSFKAVYQFLNSEDSEDIMRTVLEESFFPAVMPLLLRLYRCVNYNTECSVARNMERHVNATPKDLSVRKQYWLHDQDAVPYSAAIDHLRELLTLHSPAVKLEHIVTLSKCIINCIDEYYKDDKSCFEKSISAVGVDDILPIMTFVIIRSGEPQLVTECAIMQEFIRDSYSMGEEGFCLTSFHTALQFVARMSS